MKSRLKYSLNSDKHERTWFIHKEAKALFEEVQKAYKNYKPMTTYKQKRAVRFCENRLHIKFNGDIDNFQDVSAFLQENLDNALEREEEASYSCDIY